MLIDERFKFLTTKQCEIAKLAQEEGFITLGKIKMFYSSKEHWTRALEKLIVFNIIVPDKKSGESNIIFKRFNYNPRENENVQKTIKQTIEPLSIQKSKNPTGNLNKEKTKMREKALGIIEAAGENTPTLVAPLIENDTRKDK